MRIIGIATTTSTSWIPQQSSGEDKDIKTLVSLALCDAEIGAEDSRLSRTGLFSLGMEKDETDMICRTFGLIHPPFMESQMWLGAERAMTFGIMDMAIFIIKEPAATSVFIKTEDTSTHPKTYARLRLPRSTRRFQGTILSGLVIITRIRET